MYPERLSLQRGAEGLAWLLGRRPTAAEEDPLSVVVPACVLELEPLELLLKELEFLKEL